MKLTVIDLHLERRFYTHLRAFADVRQARRAVRQHLRPQPEHLLTGERGEDAAFFHLRERGYTVVARRWTSSRVRGDLDLVAWDGDTVVAVEVKTRTAHDMSPAETAVDRDKQTQLRKLARLWLRQLPARVRDRVGLRFDIVSVYLLPGGPEFEHFQNAFPVRARRRTVSRAAPKKCGSGKRALCRFGRRPITERPGRCLIELRRLSPLKRAAKRNTLP